LRGVVEWAKTAIDGDANDSKQPKDSWKTTKGVLVIEDDSRLLGHSFIHDDEIDSTGA